ncbi:MAG: hypothetical protein GX608_04060 [Lentisphaerae bacterium]|nr:hypothetical protein [Lentisphaerota bacterium]
MKRAMSSKERVLTALARQEPDRIPINYFANAGIDSRLRRHFGLADGDDEGLMKALGVDFRGAGAGYVGPKLHPDVPDRVVTDWGIRMRWIEHPTGGYWDYCDFPLKDAGLDIIRNWPMPSPDAHDYSGIAAACRANSGYCVVAGGAGEGDIINSTGMIRGMEQVLVDLLTDDEACLCYIDRKIGIQLEVMRRTLEAARGGIDLLWLGEDLGTQIGPLISLELFRRHIRPRHQKFVDLAKSFGIPAIIHSCGSSSWAFDDFIEMGIAAVDTLQPEAANMAPEYLKKRYGRRLAFHGCISTAGPMAFGTVEQAVADARRIMETMMPGGGYLFSPTHAIQDNSPTENVLAIYEAAAKYGVYA